MTTAEQTPTADPNPELANSWSVGTLHYTLGGLFNVFGWLLWGDLCLAISESVVLRMVPLQMQSLGASKATIGIVTGSLFSAMNWVMNPIISTTSDRYRSRLGRRMPFMLYTAVPITLFLMGFGFSTEIGGYIHAHIPKLGTAIAYLCAHLLPGCAALSDQAKMTIAMIALMMVLFRFFDLFPQCVYYYLFPDVIPKKLMGTFICLFGVTSSVGTILFHYCLLPLAGSHPRWIYGFSAGLYLFTFTLMPLLVKEGTYPPPAARRNARVLPALLGWAREVFTRRFYWKYFLTYSAFRWAYVPFNAFLILYAKEKLNLDEKQFGPLMTLVLIVQMPALFLVGPIMDRFHPTRVAIIGFAMMAVTAMAGFLFIHNRATFVGCTIAVFISVAVVYNAMRTMGARLLPQARYGQFSAANSMVSETGMLLFYYACGSLLDHMGQRYLFAWMVGFSIFGFVMIVLLYRAWLAHGGDNAYMPPAVVASL